MRATHENDDSSLSCKPSCCCLRQHFWRSKILLARNLFLSCLWASQTNYFAIFCSINSKTRYHSASFLLAKQGNVELNKKLKIQNERPHPNLQKNAFLTQNWQWAIMITQYYNTFLQIKWCEKSATILHFLIKACVISRLLWNWNHAASAYICVFKYIILACRFLASTKSLQSKCVNILQNPSLP